MGSRDCDYAHFSERFVRVMSGLSLGTHVPNLKFVLELLAFNAPKFTGSRDSDRDHAHFSETFVRDMSGLCLGTRLPNLKFVPSVRTFSRFGAISTFRPKMYGVT